VAVPRASEPAKLTVGALSAFPDAWERAREALVELYGPAECQVGPLPFDQTDYYAEEMGAPLSRWLLAFERLVGQQRIAEIKHRTNGIEAALASERRWPVDRPVNLDPGYVTLGKLVLATTKDQAHRIAVGEDIYAEVTLRFRSGRFEPLEWTYADYRQEGYLDFFARVRESLRARLRGG
jgi:hypothetical protein